MHIIFYQPINELMNAQLQSRKRPIKLDALLCTLGPSFHRNGQWGGVILNYCNHANFVMLIGRVHLKETPGIFQQFVSPR